MKKSQILLSSFAFLFMFAVSTAHAAHTKAHKFSLSSQAIKKGEKIGNDFVFNGFGCEGKNQSPDLTWTGAPEGTKSFALTMYDPDAPTGSGWWHWVVFNLPAETTKLELNAKLPSNAVASRTDFGSKGYGGPCPPKGDKPHRYYFKVFALKENLPLDSDSPAAMVGYYINQNKIAEATLMATYGR